MQLFGNVDEAGVQLSLLYKRHFGVSLVRRYGMKESLENIKLDIPDLDFGGLNELEVAGIAYDLITKEISLK